jgi:hypothetical protein
VHYIARVGADTSSVGKRGGGRGVHGRGRRGMSASTRTRAASARMQGVHADAGLRPRGRECFTPR